MQEVQTFGLDNSFRKFPMSFDYLCDTAESKKHSYDLMLIFRHYSLSSKYVHADLPTLFDKDLWK